MSKAFVAIHTKTPELTNLYNQLNARYHALAVQTRDDLTEQRDIPLPALRGGYESLTSDSYQTLAKALANRTVNPQDVILISDDAQLIQAAAALNISTILIAQSHECFSNVRGAVAATIKGAQHILGSWAEDAHRRVVSPAVKLRSAEPA